MRLNIKNLNIGYNHKTIARDINLSLLQGEFCVLLGKNGSGKSTLIKTISSIIPKLSGEIILNDKEIEQYNAKEKSKLLSTVLTDKIGLPLSVKEILYLGRQAYTSFFDILNNRDIDIIQNVVKDLELDAFLDLPIQKLSDGERQKVMIARALAQETPFIILDEPTTHLDLENKALLLKLLKKISRKQNKGILFSTHDVNLVLPIVDKVWLLDNALLKEFDTIETINQAIYDLFHSDNLKYDKSSKKFSIACEE